MSLSLNMESQTPLYQQLMEEIKRKIDVSEFRYGDKIPSEPEFMNKYSISRITVRKAVEELVTEGYLVKKQGKGTFVNKPKIRRKVENENVMSFDDACRSSGMTPAHTLLDRKVVSPGVEEKSFFELGNKEMIIFTQRVLTADGDPIMLENNYFPYHECNFLMEEKLDGSLYKLLNSKGIYPEGTKSCTLELVRATDSTAKLLQVPLGEPLFYMIAYITDSQGHPVHIGRQYIVGSRYMFNIP